VENSCEEAKTVEYKPELQAETGNKKIN